MKGGKYNEIKEFDFTVPFNPKRWNKFQIVFVDNMVNVVLNNKDILVDMLKDEVFVDAVGGTVGFGTNNVIAAFSDIKIGIIFPDAFFEYLK